MPQNTTSLTSPSARQNVGASFADDRLLVEEMNALSVKEREELLDEIHGVAKPPKETPEQLRRAFEDLRERMDEIPRKKRRALDRALFLKPSLDQDEKFLLMFLRADRFNAYKAASRMSRYFEHKLQLFGEERLVKKITLEDLDEGDLDSLSSGAVFPHPHKDRSGRTIWMFTGNRFRYRKMENLVSTRSNCVVCYSESSTSNALHVDRVDMLGIKI